MRDTGWAPSSQHKMHIQSERENRRIGRPNWKQGLLILFLLREMEQPEKRMQCERHETSGDCEVNCRRRLRLPERCTYFLRNDSCSITTTLAHPQSPHAKRAGVKWKNASEPCGKNCSPDEAQKSGRPLRSVFAQRVRMQVRILCRSVPTSCGNGCRACETLHLRCTSMHFECERIM